jgi:glycosyltransferase involved in cell wall biosynthesis
MPSLAEGFGMPVAEAMAMGVPVVTSSVGALAETAGQAALLVDPLDVAAIASALRRIVADEALHRALAVAGRANAERFTPERFAERLTQAYAIVMAEPS